MSADKCNGKAIMVNQKNITAAKSNLCLSIGAIAINFISFFPAFPQTPPNCNPVNIFVDMSRLREGEEKAFTRIVNCRGVSVPILISSMENNDINIRIGAIAALGKIGEEARTAMPALYNLLRDRDQDVQFAASHAIGEIYQQLRQPTLEEEYYYKSRNYESSNHEITQTSIGGTNNTQTYTIRRASIERKRNPPLICQIPMVSSIFQWKCPQRQRGA